MSERMGGQEWGVVPTGQEYVWALRGLKPQVQGDSPAASGQVADLLRLLFFMKTTSYNLPANGVTFIKII